MRELDENVFPFGKVQELISSKKFFYANEPRRNEIRGWSKEWLRTSTQSSNALVLSNERSFKWRNDFCRSQFPYSFSDSTKNSFHDNMWFIDEHAPLHSRVQQKTPSHLMWNTISRHISVLSEPCVSLKTYSEPGWKTAPFVLFDENATWPL